MRGGWFDHPAIMREVARLQRLAMEAIERPRRRTAQVAVVYDLNSTYYLSDSEGMTTHLRLVENVVKELYRTGAPFDMFLLPQLAETDLSRYKLIVFLNTFAMDEAQSAMVERLRKSGRYVTLWLWLPAVVGPKGIDVAQASVVTGFKLRLLRQRVPGRIRVVAKGSPLLPEGFAFGDGVPFGPALVAEDGDPIGVAEGTRYPLLASKSGGRNVFLGAPFAPLELLSALVDIAGVHRYDRNPNDIVRAASWFLVVHTKEGGREGNHPPSAGEIDRCRYGTAHRLGAAHQGDPAAVVNQHLEDGRGQPGRRRVRPPIWPRTLPKGSDLKSEGWLWPISRTSFSSPPTTCVTTRSGSRATL
jgi:hypothetical protein